LYTTCIIDVYYKPAAVKAPSIAKFVAAEAPTTTKSATVKLSAIAPVAAEASTRSFRSRKQH
jgi:hypothetical protein